MAARGVTRLAELYGRLEQMRALEVEVARTAVNEIARAEDRERDERGQQGAAARVALAAGDLSGWRLAVGGSQLQQSRFALLAAWRSERERSHQQAQAAHRASRLEQEQITRIVEERQRAARADAERREQAAADDRYLSRRSWEMQNSEAAAHG